jgi:hypothetical protein
MPAIIEPGATVEVRRHHLNGKAVFGIEHRVRSGRSTVYGSKLGPHYLTPMELTPEIIGVAVALSGFVLGYGSRSIVSVLRRRRRRRARYSLTACDYRRMEPQSVEQDWRTELERDLSELTTAPEQVPDGRPETQTLFPFDSVPETRAEANELYALAQHIETALPFCRARWRLSWLRRPTPSGRQHLVPVFLNGS